MAQSVAWTERAVTSVWPEEGRETAFLRLCGPLYRRAVLVVSRDGTIASSVLRRAKEAGAMVTALCAPERAQDAWDAGADAVMDPERQDPTWYRGAWSVIYDPAGRIGYARASRCLDRDGVYVTSAPAWTDRGRALVARVSGGPKLLRLRGSDKMSCPRAVAGRQDRGRVRWLESAP
jgi:NADPH:quinone reductase-like Zn-dependent oxidoreductase